MPLTLADMKLARDDEHWTYAQGTYAQVKFARATTELHHGIACVIPSPGSQEPGQFFVARPGGLSAWYGQDRHYLHGFPWEDCEVRMVFEELCGGFV